MRNVKMHFNLFLTTADESDDEFSTGAVVAISIVVTFIITLVVTALITYIITSLYYKHLFKKPVIRQEGDSHALTECISNDPALAECISNDPALAECISNDPAYATAKAKITMDTNLAKGTAPSIKMDNNPIYASY